jgi:lactate dehydrogenase-like 2-hydroxyacid dehydrogenase
MSKSELLVLAPLGGYLTHALESRFDLHTAGAAPDRRAIRAAVTSGSQGISNELIDAHPNLEIVAVYGVGYDRIDLAYASRRGITVTNTPDVLNDDVADLALALALAVARRLPANDAMVRAGRWEAGERPPLGRRLSGAKVGILGLGRIGSAIARRFEAFTPHLRYHNRHPVKGAAYGYVASGAELARWADVLVVAAAGGPQTRHLVDASVIEALGPEGVLINVSRGAVVDETALTRALVEGRLGGAGLDVFEDEPRTPRELWGLDNVVLQPHQGSATVETRRAMADTVLANLDAWLAGKAPPNPVSDASA